MPAWCGGGGSGPPSGTPTPTPHAYSVAGKGRGRTALREGGGTWSPPETAGTPRGLAPICSPASPPAAGPPWGTGHACAASSQRLAARRARLKVRSGEQWGVGCRAWGGGAGQQRVGRCAGRVTARAGRAGRCRASVRGPVRWLLTSHLGLNKRLSRLLLRSGRSRRQQEHSSARDAARLTRLRGQRRQEFSWPRPRKAFWHRRSAWSSQGAPVGSALQRGTQFARRYPIRSGKGVRPKGKTLRRVEKTFRTLIPRHPATFGCVASQWGVFIRGDHQNCSCHGAGRPPVFVRFSPLPPLIAMIINASAAITLHPIKTSHPVAGCDLFKPRRNPVFKF